MTKTNHPERDSCILRNFEIAKSENARAQMTNHPKKYFVIKINLFPQFFFYYYDLHKHLILPQKQKA